LTAERIGVTIAIVPTLPLALIACAAVYSSVVFELVLESAKANGERLVLFGSVLASPGHPVGIWMLSGVSATAALAMVTAVAYARGRRLEHRMAAELDERWEEISQRTAGDAARNELLSWRLAELQTLVDRLMAERAAARREGADLPRLVVVPDAAQEGVATGA